MSKSWWNWYIATTILFILTIWFIGTCANAAEKTCPKVKVENPQHSTWVKADKDALAVSKVHCVKFYPCSPCLVKFIKKSTNNYWSICGVKR